MSPFFIKKLRSVLKCRDCSSKSIARRRFCNKHLEKAKQHWFEWKEGRKRDEICCYCDDDSVFGWLRCAHHALQNRLRCRNWVNENKDRQKRNHYDRKMSFIQQGLCGGCGKHPIRSGVKKNGSGYTRCNGCAIKGRIYNRGEKPKGYRRITDTMLKAKLA